MKISEILEKFKFLDERSAKEPFIFDVLNEILSLQTQSLPTGAAQLATMDWLKKSRNIKIPYSSSREKNIEYIMEHLLKNYKDYVRPIVTFDFTVEEESKKLIIAEIIEYTVMIKESDLERIKALRDSFSLENLMKLLSKYRILNLSKLIKKSVYKTDLSRIIKIELGKKIFTFKNYSIDHNKIEYAEDYCFHAQNYEAVRNSLKLNKLKEILSIYSDLVNRRLKKFGILNPDVSDYRDNKLDYLFSILLEDLSGSLAEKDMMEVKNIHSLRTCLIKVDKILDPSQIINEDLVKFIRENKICTNSDLVHSLADLSDDLLNKWANRDNLARNNIITLDHEDGRHYFIDGSQFLDFISDLNQLILYQQDQFAALPYNERHRAEQNMDVLYKTALRLLSSDDLLQHYLEDAQSVEKLKSVVADYENFKKHVTLKKEMDRKQPEKNSGRSFIQWIKDIFGSLFGGGKVKSAQVRKSETSPKREISHETRKVYEKIIDMSAPVLPLSDFLELTPDNDLLIDQMINEFRDHNLKIVVPIYNARKVLYPKRSQKLIIPDSEYLLLPPDIIKSAEDVRAFTDRLIGVKVKDELIPGSAILAIEKYLLTLYRQKRALMLKKEL